MMIDGCKLCDNTGKCPCCFGGDCCWCGGTSVRDDAPDDDSDDQHAIALTMSTPCAPTSTPTPVQPGAAQFGFAY